MLFLVVETSFNFSFAELINCSCDCFCVISSFLQVLFPIDEVCNKAPNVVRKDLFYFIVK